MSSYWRRKCRKWCFEKCRIVCGYGRWVSGIPWQTQRCEVPSTRVKWKGNWMSRKQMSRLMTKSTIWPVCPAKTQISLGIRPVWSESSQCTQWVAEDPMFLHADSKDSDQTGRMPRLIWVFAGRTSLCWFCQEAAQMSQFIRKPAWRVPGLDNSNRLAHLTDKTWNLGHTNYSNIASR